MQDCVEIDILVVTTTLGSSGEARRLAGLLVEHRLAACVQVDEVIRSVYRWEGKVCDEAEVRLVIKTLPQRESDLLAFFAEHHPYQLPQFVAVTARASPAYAAWVRGEASAPLIT